MYTEKLLCSKELHYSGSLLLVDQVNLIRANWIIFFVEIHVSQLKNWVNKWAIITRLFWFKGKGSKARTRSLHSVTDVRSSHLAVDIGIHFQQSWSPRYQLNASSVDSQITTNCTQPNRQRQLLICTNSSSIRTVCIPPRKCDVTPYDSYTLPEQKVTSSRSGFNKAMSVTWSIHNELVILKDRDGVIINFDW